MFLRTEMTIWQHHLRRTSGNLLVCCRITEDQWIMETEQISSKYYCSASSAIL